MLAFPISTTRNIYARPLTSPPSRGKRETGNYPFAAMPVGPNREVLMEQMNCFATAGDGTGHAERVLVTQDQPCKTVVEAAQRPVEVIGPLLSDESAVVHKDFW